eukprot:7146320-Pyramimonas_sp.AAC.1
MSPRWPKKFEKGLGGRPNQQLRLRLPLCCTVVAIVSAVGGEPSQAVLVSMANGTLDAEV